MLKNLSGTAVGQTRLIFKPLIPFRRTLLQIGYLSPAATKKLMERMRRVYARAKLEKEEVNLLRGLLTLTQVPRKHNKY
jgi:tRNA C32,U32 (ribose-2'-O)-methylase TrmJ